MITVKEAHHQTLDAKRRLVTAYFEELIKEAVNQGEFSVTVFLDDVVTNVPCVELDTNTYIEDDLTFYGFSCNFEPSFDNAEYVVVSWETY